MAHSLLQPFNIFKIQVEIKTSYLAKLEDRYSKHADFP